MPKVKVRYVGLDVHKDSIVIAVAEPGRRWCNVFSVKAQ